MLSAMQKKALKQPKLIDHSHPAEDSCIQNSFRTKYREIMNQKQVLQRAKFQDPLPKAKKEETQKYEEWISNYKAERALGSKEPLHDSLKLSFREQLKSTHLAYYTQILLQVSIAVLLYFVFTNIVQGAYQTAANLYLILAIIIIALLRLVLSQFAVKRLHSIGFQIYQLMSEALIRKSLKCSILSNKSISISEMSQIMHIECEKLMTYPHKSVAIVEGAMYVGLLSVFTIYLGGIPGFFGIVCFISMISIRFCIKSILTAREQEFSRQTSVRVKTEIEVFSMIKFIKVNSLQSCYFNKLRKIRMVQIQKLKAKLLVVSFMSGISIVTKQVALVVIMKLISLMKGNFGLPVAFAINMSFSYLNLHNIVKNINDYADIKLALKKIEKFLNTEEIDNSYLTHGAGNGQSAIDIRNGCFYWDKEEDNAEQVHKKPTSTFRLKNINVQINRGELVALIGTYASGKSSFANCLLGEMKNQSASQIKINGTIAYCCQIPWIMNDTVKNNILFGKPYDQSRYFDAIKYASLGDDLLILSDRDNTLIGEKGSTLSGGQKARISLARALYSDADIFILDDILSAVDAHVGSFLFNQTIKKYLKQKTVLLITHSLYFVKHTDRILVFDQGQIVQQAAYQQLQNTPIFKKVQVTDLKKSEKDPLASVRANSILRATKDDLDLLETNNDSIVEGEKQELSFSTILSIFVKRNSGCTFILLTVVFTIALGLLVAFFRIQLNTWSTSSNQSEAYFFYLLIGVNLLIIVLIFLNSMTLYISPMFQTIHDDIIRSLLFAPLSYFQSVPLDKIVSRISNELNSNDKIFTLQFMQAELFCQLFLSFFFGIIYVYLHSKQYFILLYIFLHFGIMGYLYVNYLYQDLLANQLQQSLIVPIKSKYSEILNGLSSVRAYNKIKFLFEEIARRTDIFGKASDMRSEVERKIKLVVAISTNSFNIFTLIFMFAAGNVVGNLLIFLLFNIFAFEDALLRFHTSAYEVVARFKSLGRCEQLARLQPEKGYKSYLANNYVENQEFKQEYFEKEVFPKGRIVFQNYSLRYKPQLNDVLKNLSFAIEAGEKIGIVGRTGSGKSSMMLGLLRIIEASSGKIVIDGVDTNTLSLQQLRSNINIILQDHFLFTGKLRDNVDPTHSHSDQQVIEALKLCGVWQEFQKKEGINSLIQEGGNNLSSGEKQLINISRSLLSPKRIVLIDQATASIDLQTDAQIQKVIRKHFANKTVLTIAHRINTVIDSDRILVLSNGKVAEFGSPSMLLSNPNSLFAQLYKEAGKKKSN